MKFTLNNAKVPDGSVLVFGIRYVPEDDSGPHSASRVFTYAMLKAAGSWYVTGTGQTPQAAGWGAVERWLDRDGREVVWVRAGHVDGLDQIWPAAPASESAAPATGENPGTERLARHFIEQAAKTAR
jgi:hypothetical protein